MSRASKRAARAGRGAMSTAFIFILLVLLMLTGMPISIALGLTVLTFLFLLTSVPIEAVALKLFTGIERFEIMAIPFFILAGNFLTHGGVARRMIAFARTMIGHWAGGLGIAATMAAALFSAVSGSSPATVVAIGSIMLPAMLAIGYPRRFAAGVLVTGGSLGNLIPPSIIMVIYAVATGGAVYFGPDGQKVASASVGQLFMAGIVPGIILACHAVGDHLVSRVEEQLRPHPEGDLARALACVPGFRLGHFADRAGARRHLFRLVHADRSRRHERGLRLRDRDLHLQGHEVEGRAEGAARLGQSLRDAPLHHHQRGAVLIPDDA